MHYAVALSEHPDPGIAVGEVVGQVLDRIGPGPDLAVVFITGHPARTVQQLGTTIRSTLGARTLLGATAVSVLAHRQELEEGTAIVLWAGRTGACRALRLKSSSTPLPNLESGSRSPMTHPFSYQPYRRR